MANIAKIKQYSISNGEGLRTAVFFSGCTHHCEGCFNKELWDFNYGTSIDYNEILSTINEHISGLSLLGGDPLCGDNFLSSLELCKRFKQLYPNKTIWLWTGFTIEFIKNCKLKEILDYVDVVIDGKFIESEYEYGLKWRGSKNQRILYKNIDF